MTETVNNSRLAEIRRETMETRISLCMNLDGEGRSNIQSGCGFLDHMLCLLARHALIDLDLTCDGDTEVDFHHSTEDIGICLGRAIRDALGDRRGIRRYGNMLLPMDEALVLCALDISGRGGFYPELAIPTQKVGDFDTELCEEFFFALSREAGITIHLRQITGHNSHHIIEACFKAFARALREAVEYDKRQPDSVPSTKGTLS